MYTIRIIWIGKRPPDFIERAISHYVEKLRPFVKTELVQVKSHTASTELAVVRRIETKAALRFLPADETNRYLDERGCKMKSTAFAGWLEDLKERETSRVNFLIGGAYGLDQSILNFATPLGLSSMTLPHHLARLMLIEQLYRGFTIMNGHKYHH